MIGVMALDKAVLPNTGQRQGRGRMCLHTVETGVGHQASQLFTRMHICPRLITAIPSQVRSLLCQPCKSLQDCPGHCPYHVLTGLSPQCCSYAMLLWLQWCDCVQENQQHLRPQRLNYLLLLRLSWARRGSPAQPCVRAQGGCVRRNTWQH